jgi:hypothetical protein
LTNGTNDSASDVAHLKKVDDGLTVSHLLLPRDFFGLTKKGRELKCLTDGSGRFVNVHLLRETGGALEGFGKRAAVNEEVAGDSAKIEALG